FIAPTVEELRARHGLKPGALVVVSSHTHSAPVLENTLTSMYNLSPADEEQIHNYSAFLKSNLAEVVAAALADLKPARLEQGRGRDRCGRPGRGLAAIAAGDAAQREAPWTGTGRRGGRWPGPADAAGPGGAQAGLRRSRLAVRRPAATRTNRKGLEEPRCLHS